MAIELQSVSILKFQNQIVSWFNKNARKLPWRETSDPYKIWISEVMLQQTQVSTVIPYYDRFLKRFPNLESLAASTEDEVLKYWEGLGYYRRGKNLRLAAQMIVEKFSGKFPDTREELLSIPGIGPYSAGAILSIAFRKTAPALDGNLIRVYARFYGIQDDVAEVKTLKVLWKLAGEHAPDDSKMTREFAEGMMELGALICTPKNVKCTECPVSKNCVALKKDLVALLPRKRPDRKREKLYEQVWLQRKKNKVAFYPKGSDPKFPDFMRLPHRFLKAPPILYEKKFKYSVTHRDFEVFLMKTSTVEKRIIWLDRAKLQEILLPAIDRKIIRSAL
ncbi:MAG: mutY [Bacteriovoracaceae bacterium]|nr:mutY [Bacteriovoracaceae bacterium]